jgi:hypothetical protein
MYRLLTGLFVLSLATLAAGGVRVPVRAQGEPIVQFYFPILAKYEPTRYDDFSDENPVWYYKQQEAEDVIFFRRDGRFVGLIEDNSANSIAYPGWRPSGDFVLSADARFSDGEWMNALGLVFGGSDDWQEYYGFLLAYNFRQHYWAVVRARPPEQNHTYLSDDEWGGVPNFVQWYSRWNTLMVVRQGASIEVYCNGIHMPGGTYTDSRYGANRLVGLLVTSYEWAKGEIEFDNFEVTPIIAP